MKGVLVLCLVLCLLAIHTAPCEAHTANDRCRNFQQESKPYPGDDFPAESFFDIVHYDFELVDWMGWTRVDNTIDVDTFWHVDNFALIAPGDFGMLTPIEQTKSMWCGSRPNMPLL